MQLYNYSHIIIHCHCVYYIFIGNSVNGTIYNYMKEYRNPCWTEKLPFNLTYAGNNYIKFFGRSSRAQFNNVTTAFRILGRKYQKEGAVTRLRCLPAVYIAGVHKAGKANLTCICIRCFYFYPDLRFLHICFASRIRQD